MELVSASYQINIVEGKPVIARALEFKNGDLISFSVQLSEESKKSSLTEIHRESAQKVIDMLQTWLNPK
jgi:hypothetical protein